MKLYKSGLIVGRFQIIHTGHEMMINTALSLCESVAVFVGSANEERTYKNPFTFSERKEMLSLIFGDKISIYPLDDIGVGNNSKWGEYVLNEYNKNCKTLPDLLISGKEERRINWFDFPKGKNISELYVPKTIDISATKLRENIVNGNYSEWEKYTNEKLWDKYAGLREIINSCKNETETKSI